MADKKNVKYGQAPKGFRKTKASNPKTVMTENTSLGHLRLDLDKTAFNQLLTDKRLLQSLLPTSTSHPINESGFTAFLHFRRGSEKKLSSFPADRYSTGLLKASFFTEEFYRVEEDPTNTLSLAVIAAQSNKQSNNRNSNFRSARLPKERMAQDLTKATNILREMLQKLPDDLEERETFVSQINSLQTFLKGIQPRTGSNKQEEDEEETKTDTEVKLQNMNVNLESLNVIEQKEEVSADVLQARADAFLNTGDGRDFESFICSSPGQTIFTYGGQDAPKTDNFSFMAVEMPPESLKKTQRPIISYSKPRKDSKKSIKK